MEQLDRATVKRAASTILESRKWIQQRRQSVAQLQLNGLSNSQAKRARWQG